jgi:hypothetical protein
VACALTAACTTGRDDDEAPFMMRMTIIAIFLVAATPVRQDEF